MRKHSIEEKIRICEEYLSGKRGACELCRAYGLSRGKAPGVFWRWVSQYRKYGREAFCQGKRNRTYTKAFKEQVVREYLSGNGSLLDLCTKHNISTEETLLRWVRCYNANIELKGYKSGQEVYMANSGRKTAKEERKEIAEYCIAHNKDYKGTSVLYNVSYSQVYNWVRKYLSDGEQGLEDRRGQHKTDEEVDELERLRRENLRLKQQLKEQSMAVELLKKVRELEGM